MSQVQLSDQNQRAIQMAANGDSTVLLLGATGTGKSSLARRIHDSSKRRLRPFVTINLATVHEGTIESELFGHERGSFTGAESRRVGRLEMANGGTVFLDEIGELTPRLQARLLEFLQSKTITPVGSNREARLDVRIIAATHRDLEKLVREGRFREDLLHRIRILTVKLPSLAELSDAFGEILHSILESVSIDLGKRILRLTPELATMLEAHSWPGNFRELRNVLEYAVQATATEQIGVEDLPPWFVEANSFASLPMTASHAILGVAEIPLSLDFYETMTRFERQYVELILRHFGGRMSLAARKTGVQKTTFLRRLRNLGVHPSLLVQQGPPSTKGTV